MYAKLAIAAAIAVSVGACAVQPYDSGISGHSPANFNYKSDGENARALLAASESGKAQTWAVSESSYGAVSASGPAYADRARRNCQPLKHERDGAARQVTACKGADGVWVVAEWSPDKGE